MAGSLVQQRRERVNPFYVILVVAGVAFVLTACVYGIVMLRDLHAGRGGMDLATQPALIQWVDRHGVTMIVGELIVLGIATVAAIATDPYWSGNKTDGRRE